MDFGTNPAAGTTQRKKKEEVSHGIATVELANGQKLDGYIVLSAKNIAKLGITADAVKGLEEAKKKGVLQVKLHVQFGERELAVAEPVEIAFA